METGKIDKGNIQSRDMERDQDRGGIQWESGLQQGQASPEGINVMLMGTGLKRWGGRRGKIWGSMKGGRVKGEASSDREQHVSYSLQ